MSTVFVSFSGGMDSATLLGHAVAVKGKHNVRAVGFSYPSKHNALELRAGREVGNYYGVDYHLIDVSGVFASFKSDLLKSGGELPQGHYEEESMRRTVVPCRNLIFLSVLAGYAESQCGDEVWLGVHAGDHFIYPDCRPMFFADAGEAVNRATDGKVRLKAPFLHSDKAKILALGLGLTPPVPYRLTRTCYSDGEVACGKCGSCAERLWAFEQCKTVDPIEYLSRELTPKKG
jgi:7-cyano-7-deazaguanine synthase